MAEVHAGLLTKGITLSYGAKGTAEYGTALTNLMEIPEIGNGAKEKLDVTTLEDEVKTYIAGLADSGQELAFKFLYEKNQFQSLSALADTQAWKVAMPDGVNATFNGTPSVKYDSAAPNAAITYTLTITVESAITFA